MILKQIKEGVFELSGEVYAGDSKWIIEEMRYQGFENLQNIDIYLDTAGGSVIDGNSIYNYLKSIKGKKTIYIKGLVASIGVIIMSAGDIIKISENAFVMVHAPSVSINGNSEELKKASDTLLKMQEIFISVLLEKTKKDKTIIEQWMNGDNWFSAAQCLELGLCDEIIDKIISDEKIAKAKINFNKKNNKMEKEAAEIIIAYSEKIILRCLYFYLAWAFITDKINIVSLFTLIKGLW